MPSPFPGMDPFIESQSWQDFHFRLIGAISRQLQPQLRPRYIARVEARVYVEQSHAGHAHFVPDVSIAREPPPAYSAATSSGTAVAAIPVSITLPALEEIREYRLEIRRPRSEEVVTAIEVLSPSNKRPNSAGQFEYLRKRAEILATRTHLVEIDLLRGGERPPVQDSPPPSDYLVVVSRRETRPRAEAYPIALRNALPGVPVPLDRGDPDVLLDLQPAVTEAYDEGDYGRWLDYSQPVEPPLPANDQQWVRLILSRQVHN